MISLKDRRTKVLAILTLVVMLLGVLSVARISPVEATSTPFSRHVVFVIMENHALSAITSASAPNMTSLASTYAGSTNYVGPPNSTYDPSLPNYLLLTSGRTVSCAKTDPDPSSCTDPYANIVDRFNTAGISFKFYMENMPSNCTASNSYPYEVHHNPLPYYNDSAATSACANLDVPAGSTRCAQGAANFTAINGPNGCDNALISDLNSTSAPSFMWLTPNMCNDMHDCSVGTGNTYLSYLVPTILTTKTFEQDHTATIIITFDECSCSGYGTTPVYFVVAGPGAVRIHSSSTKYTHINLLQTWENNWGLQCMANDCGTLKLMTEFFIPSFAMSTSPSTVSIFCNIYGCDPGHTVNSTLTITGVNGFNGSVALSYVAPSNSVSGVYLTGQPTVNVPLGTPMLLNVTAHGSGTTSGTFVWTINGSVQGFSINTAVTITYTWCAHCVLPP